ncbi:MAG: glycerophosphodiester phosphodiesterase [Acidobacteria bacterium]|nr:glycerophosphodiester phosphodiesterase [Acidobacteriota bacterium]
MILSFLTGILMTTLAAESIQVHGHRGARAVRPENTLPAFEYAITIGVDVIELDMAVTRDNVVVVSHDARMNPAFCTGPSGTRVIREMTLAELRRWDCGAKGNPAYPKQQSVPGTRVPTIDEVFALAPRGEFHFNIETKITPKNPELTLSPEEFVRLVAEAIERHKLASRVVLQSFDFRTLHAMKKRMPNLRLSALIDASVAKDFVATAREAGAGIISPHLTIVTPDQVAKAHAAGLQVVPWTANTPSEWEKLAAAKVDAIISDDPAALIHWLKAKGLHR